MVEEMFFMPARMLPSECLCAPWIGISSSPPGQRMQKFDILQFRLEVATSLINSFCSRQRAANQDGDCLTRRNVALGHWPTNVENKRDCIVCMKKHTRLNLPRAEVRHQTRNKCSHCDVYLCIEKDRNCFAKYHTKLEYWTD